MSPTYDRFAGVDPGLHGATCLLSAAGAILELEPLPLVEESGRDAYDLAAIRERVRAWSRPPEDDMSYVCSNPVCAGTPEPGQRFCQSCDPKAESKAPRVFTTIEQLDPLPARLGGAFANHARGEARAWAWALTFVHAPHRLARPQTWQSAFRTTGKRGGWKKSVARIKALELDVGGELRKRLDAQTGKGAKERREGLVDAYLLAEWGRRWVAGGMKPQGGKRRA